eukprot:92105_1
MAKSLDDNRVLFGLLQIQIGEGTFARYKNIFVHFQGEKMKILARARANKRLAVAKELIGHTHAPLVVNSRESFTVAFVFKELERIFVADSIAGYQSSGGKQQDINSLRIDYQKRMEQAKLEAQEQQMRLMQERLRLEREAKEKALEEEAKRLEELKAEAERQKMQMEREKKEKAEEERRLRHEREEKERLERKRLREEEEEKELQQRMAANPDANKEEELKEIKAKKKKKRRRKKRKKKDDWGDDKPWTPERVLSAIHAPMSPVNWGLFKPSRKQLIPVKWGHGALNELRSELKDDEVQYGLMRLSFGSGKFKRSTWVYFLWTPDTMSIIHKKNQKRMKHVSYNGAMQNILKPWTVSLTAETKEKVTIDEWILRVKKVVVVDGDEEITEESFRKALEDENEYIAQLKAKEKQMIEKQKEEEMRSKMEQMEETKRLRQLAADRKQSNLYTRVELKQVDSNTKPESVKTPTLGLDGNYYFNHEVDYDAIQAQALAAQKEREKKSQEERDKMIQSVQQNDDDSTATDDDDEEEEREPSPEPVIELTEEELAQIEEQRKKKEAEELAKRTQNEMEYRRVLQSKMVLESVELVKRTGE